MKKSYSDRTRQAMRRMDSAADGLSQLIRDLKPLRDAEVPNLEPASGDPKDKLHLSGLISKLDQALCTLSRDRAWLEYAWYGLQ